MAAALQPSIWELAGINLRKRPEPKPFDNQFVRDMLRLRRAKVFEAIWIDADVIRVRLPGVDPELPPQKLTKFEAERLIDAWKKRSS